MNPSPQTKLRGDAPVDGHVSDQGQVKGKNSVFHFWEPGDAAFNLFDPNSAKVLPRVWWRYCWNIRHFLFDLFHLVTWDDLDLYYGHKAQEMILTDVSDTIHADSLALFALNIEILLADVTKPEKSKILTLTWPVTSSVTSRSNFWPCMGSSRTGLSNGVWNLEIRPVVWEISGGALCPPPQQDVLLSRPQRGEGYDTCFLGYFSRRGRWWYSFHFLKSSVGSTSEGRVKNRSQMSNFKIHKSQEKGMYLDQFLLRHPVVLFISPCCPYTTHKFSFEKLTL